MIRSTSPLVAAVGALALLACEPAPTAPDTNPDATVATAKAAKGRAPAATDPALLAEIEKSLSAAALELQTEWAAVRGDLRLHATAWVAAPGSRAIGTTVFFNNRGDKQIRSGGQKIKWVPGDPRRGGRTDLTYSVLPFGSNLPPAAVDAAIDRAMSTWDGGTQCSSLPIPEVPLSASPDIIHVGFAPMDPNVLAATAVFVFVDPVTLEPTDIDGDGAHDYGLALIQYNSLFLWAIDPTNPFLIDVETIALHEAGHGLGQEHFGKAFVTLANNKLHFSPLAVMNAAYSGVQQRIRATDLGGHCGLFGSWPN